MSLKSFINRETISYLIFGVLTTAVDNVSFILLYNIWQINLVVSMVVAWVLAVAFAYVTNRIWVFESKADKLKDIVKEISAFVSARVLSLLFSVVFVYICEKIFKLITDNKTVVEWCVVCAKIGSGVFVVIMNYFFSKLFIFNNKEEKF